MKQQNTSYPLRLPVSLREALDEMAKQDGVSVNQFITLAVAEKIAALKTAQFFTERKARSDQQVFEKILTREGGMPPQAGDEILSD